VAGASAPITFSEYAVNTAIGTQYDSAGVWFSAGGGLPQIVSDGSNPSSPVLASGDFGSPFGGSIRGSFVWPGTTLTAAVDYFTIDVGYIDTAGTTSVDVYGATGNLLGTIPITTTGIVTVSSDFVGVTDFVVHGVDPAGWGIDNLAIGPERVSPSQRDWTESIGGGNPGEIPRVCNSGDPVSCATGDFSESTVDAAVAGRGPGLAAARTYSSVLASHQSAGDRGRFGFGWTDSYASTLSVVGANVTITQGNGSRLHFTAAGNGAFTTNAWTTGRLTQRADGSYRLDYRDRTFALYSAGGQLTTLGDRSGAATTLTYSNGQAMSITDAAGRALTYAYNPNGTVATVTDPMGKVTHFAYDGAGNLTQVTDPAGSVTGYGYNTAHQLTDLTDPRGSTTHNVFDGAGRVTSQRDRTGATMTWQYSGGTDYGTGTAGITVVTDPLGRATRMTFDELGDLKTRTLGSGTTSAQTWAYSYDLISGHLTTATDPNGHTNQFTWDSNGDLVTILDPAGAHSTQTFNATHDLTSVTRPVLGTTNYTYDTAGDLATVTRHLDTSNQDAVVQFAHGDTAHPSDITRVTDPSGRTTDYAYDSYGNRTDVTDGLGHRTHSTYNLDGWLTSTISARGQEPGADPTRFTTTFTRNDAGRVTAMTAPAGQSAAYEYDANGNLTKSTDGNHHTKTYTYDAADKLLSTTAGGSTMSTNYDAAGQVKAQIDGRGKSTQFGYDALGRMLSSSDPLNRPTTYAYDPAGNLHTLTDPAGRATTYSYDADGRRTSVAYSDGTPGLHYTYDNAGELTSTIDGTGTTTYTHDSLGRITSNTPAIGSGLTYTYDLAGNLTQLLRVSGSASSTITRTFDAAGRMNSVTDPAGNRTTFGFNPDGALTTISYPNAVVSQRVYNDADQVTNIKDTGPGTIAGTTNTLLNLPYTRDGQGLVQTQNTTAVPTPTVGGVSPADAATTMAGIGRDNLNRFTGTSLTAAPTVAVESYAYDAGNNLIQRTLGAVTDTFSYDAAHQLTSVANPTNSTTFSYDQLGERTNAALKGPLGNVVANTTYQYDQGGHLTKFQGPPVQAITSQVANSGSVGINYRYNALGLLASLDWDLGEGSYPQLVGDETLGTSYITGPAGIVVEQYLYLGAVPLYLESDQLGSTRVVTDNQARPIIAYTYDGFGRTTATPITKLTGVNLPSAITPIQFAGSYTDLLSGLIYLRSRWYDPTTANFLTRDPAELTTREPYSYANNNPIDLTDPTGKCPVCIILLGAALFSTLDLTAQAADHIAHGCDPLEQTNWYEVGGAGIAGALQVLPGAFGAGGIAAGAGGELVAPSASGLASDLADASGGTLTDLKSGYSVTIPSGSRGIVVRVMEEGGGRTNYWRISIPGKQAFTVGGEASTDAALTHIPISGTSLQDILSIIAGLG
jgi:RHS repeat-associated protein